MKHACDKHGTWICWKLSKSLETLARQAGTAIVENVIAGMSKQSRYKFASLPKRHLKNNSQLLIILL